jgi:ABC-type branched-subunit amino acid transport system substrate-binding protein
VADEVEERSGQEADAFALSAYDALSVIVDTVEAVGGVDDIDALKTAFGETAGEFDGLTGPLLLNQAGDRAEGPFDFWIVCQEGEEFEWRNAGTFLPDGSPIGGIACEAE